MLDKLADGERHMNTLIKEKRPLTFYLHSNKEAGFTLVELAVVVIIIGFLATMGISALNVQLASAAISLTKKKQDTIKDALIAYLGKNSRLPCPDSDVTAPDGIENRGATPLNTLLACSSNFGIIPYQTLGLPKSAALDGWENYFSYQVSNDSTTAANLDWTLTTSFHTGNAGVITVKDRNSTDLTNIVAVVVSHGQDGLGAYTSKGTRNVIPDVTVQPDQYQNTQNNTTPRIFFRRDYTENASAAGGAFDDILLALSRDDILIPLIKDGSMKSPEAQWFQQIADIQNYIVPQLLKKALQTPPVCTAMIPLPPQYQIDPWGNTVSISTPQTLSATAIAMYTLSTTSASVNAPSASSLFPSFVTACP